MGTDARTSQDGPPIASVRANRPKVPAAIAREVLTEAGHRCAVCGDSCPLERAHIISWCESREHRVENLICLCANCHQRADLENWGSKTLYKYKQKPWILRKKLEADSEEPAKRVQLTLAMDFDAFDARAERLLVHALAAFLEIPLQAIRICSIERGSVKVLMELPANSAEQLLRIGGLPGIELDEQWGALGTIRVRADVGAPTSEYSAEMTCQDIGTAIFLFFDNELDEALLIPFRKHVVSCADCAKKVDYTRKLLSAVRERSARHEAPKRLLERILMRLPGTSFRYED